MIKLWQELQRRHVVRVGIVYALVAWLLAQVADLVLDNFMAPQWVMQTFLFVLIAGLPVTLIVAWAFELTPQGFRREVSASAQEDVQEPVGAGSSSKVHYVAWVGAAIALSVIIIMGVRFAEQRRAVLVEEVPARVVVAVFENGTGDASLDLIGRLAADVISEGLQRTGIIDVVPPNTALHASGTIHGQSDPVIRLAQETGATHAVAGTYYRDGDTIQFHAQIIAIKNDVKKLQHVAIEPVVGPYDRPGEAINALRQNVMGAMASIIDPRIEQPAELMGHLPGYAAYRAFIEGLEIFWRADFANSRRHFQRAIELDPNYHMPRILLVYSYTNANEWAEAVQVIEELELRRNKLSPYEGYRLDQLVAAANGDIQAGYRAARQASAISPEFGPVFDGAALAIQLNRPQEAIEAIKTIDTNRVLIGWTLYWELLTGARHMLGEHDEELSEALEARELYPDMFIALFVEARALAALGDTEGLQQVFDAGDRLGVQPFWTAAGLLRVTGEELIAHGWDDAGQDALERAINWYHALPAAELETLQLGLATTLLSARRVDEAVVLLEPLNQKDPDRLELIGTLGVARAMQGDRAALDEINEQLENMSIDYSFGSIAVWQARIAAASGDKEKVMVFLRRAFAEGTSMGDWLHRVPEFQSLRDYPPFQELLRPVG